MNNSPLTEEAAEFAEKSEQFGFVRPQAIADVFEGKYIIVNGKRMIDCTRLDYISIGSSPEVKRIMIESITNSDLSCPASQMVIKTEPNAELEKSLASFHGMSSSVVFTSGYATNQNVMTALGMRMNTSYFQPYRIKGEMGKESMKIPTIFYVDFESHYSLKQGIKIARMQSENCCFSYGFNSGDYGDLENKVQKSFKEHGDNVVRLIVSDTLSSTTGRIFDINALCQIAEKYNCIMYLDEAHAIGALGIKGSGIAASSKCFQDNKKRVIIMGTLTKAVSLLGGYVTMQDENLMSLLRAFCPQYIFSAPIPPWMASAIVKIIKMIQGHYGDIEREKLRKVSLLMRQSLNEKGFNTLESDSHIIPILIGDDEKAIAAQNYMEGQGFLPSLFYYPAVPQGCALIRFSLCSDITEEEIICMVAALERVREKIRF